MTKVVLHLFHADPASLKTVPTLAERMNSIGAADLEVFVFGPAEQMLADPGQTEFNNAIDGLIKAGHAVTACIGVAQQMGAEDALRARGIALESAATAFPRFAAEGATVISF